MMKIDDEVGYIAIECQNIAVQPKKVGQKAEMRESSTVWANRSSLPLADFAGGNAHSVDFANGKLPEWRCRCHFAHCSVQF